MVRSLKYSGWRSLAPHMGALMARVPLPGGPARAPTAVVPVPTLRSRARRRGYNQAALLASEVARRRSLQLLHPVRRRGGGGSQVSLQVEERAANVETSFEPAPGTGIPGVHRDLLVVDDVLTTGATAAAVARVLEQLGARAVTVLTFARALPSAVDAGSE